MTITITRLFDTYDHAGLAVADLDAAGIPQGDISLVANNADDRVSSTVPATHATDGAGAGASIGTVLGGGAGLLAGRGLLAIPGIGPVVAAGWLVATAVGAAVGAVSGGLVGSLVGAGVSEKDAHVYAEGVRRGGTLVTVRAEDVMAATVTGILDRHHPVDAAARGEEYRAEGWSRFDETTQPYPNAPVRTTETTPML
jgi:hypothetical protein